MACRALALAAFLATGAAVAVDDAAVGQCAAMSDPAARLACYDALAGHGPADAPAAAGPAAAPASADFGKPRVEPKQAERLEARVVGTLRDWQPGTLIKLDNGQTWKVSADQRGYYPDVPEHPEVVITRSFLGAYWMEIRAINRKIKVKRVG